MNDFTEDRKRSPGRPPRSDDNRAFESRAQEERASETWDDVIVIEGSAGSFPPVPQDPNWHYCWVRVPSALIEDATSAMGLMNGAAKFRPVRPSDIPALAYLHNTSGVTDGEVIRFMDTILCRTEQGRWEAIQRGEAKKAREQLAITRRTDARGGQFEIKHDRISPDQQSAETFA